MRALTLSAQQPTFAPRQRGPLFDRAGSVEGGDLVVERLSGEGRTERYAEVARELARLSPEVNNFLRQQS